VRRTAAGGAVHRRAGRAEVADACCRAGRDLPIGLPVPQSSLCQYNWALDGGRRHPDRNLRCIGPHRTELLMHAHEVDRYSGSQKSCVEVALTTTHADVRGSGHLSGPALTFSLSASEAFLTRAKF
jgi:hypothetical protein